jgi:hypothetical protein
LQEYELKQAFADGQELFLNIHGFAKTATLGKKGSRSEQGLQVVDENLGRPQGAQL